MRIWVALVLLAAACGDDGGSHMLADAPRPDAPIDAAPDAPIDAAPDAPCEHVLFTGGIDAAAQGWTAMAIPPDTVTLGADYTEIATTTSGTGGALLYSLPQAVDPTLPFRVEFVVDVASVDNHNQYDAAAALLASFTSGLGTMADRSAMVYLDNAAIGFADDTQHAAFTVVDGNYHTYVLASDGAGTLTVTADGTQLLSRTGFAPTGAIAFGDQTNDPGYDATTRVRSVTALCPN